MKLSLVIPTFNAAVLFDKTLSFLSNLDIDEQDSVEVIVVDDGSSDETPQIAERYFGAFDQFSYIFRPRDQWSCRSRARNLGINCAVGDVLILVDCGMLLPPNFVTMVAGKYRASRSPDKTVLLAKMAGVFINPEVDDISMVADLNPDRLFFTVQSLLKNPSWRDHREPLFDSVNGNLNLLPAPWALGWSGAMVVPTGLTRECGGFDESFMNWGGEDSEFSYRLYRRGALFEVDDDIVSLRVPRQSLEDPRARSTSNMSNVKKIHSKHRTFDTEVYTVYPGMYYNQILSRLRQLIITPTIPIYGTATVACLNEVLGDQGEANLLIGSDHLAFITSLNISHVFVINSLFGQRLQSAAPGLCVERTLGTHTFYEDKFFDTVIATDFIRTLGSNFILHLCRELRRISKRLIIVLTQDFRPVSKRQDGAGQWMAEDEMAHLIQNEGMTMAKTSQINKHVLFTIS